MDSTTEECKVRKCKATCLIGLRVCQEHYQRSRCSQEGCTKAKIGVQGLCVAHGGGRRCAEPGCDKAAQGKTFKCVAHGGGRRCAEPGCPKATAGSTTHCAEHGGGKKCVLEGCDNFATGRDTHCRAHGGGRRCTADGCEKSAADKVFCILHGGGRRCQYMLPDSSGRCPNAARSGAAKSSGLCKRHGGGVRCSIQGCPKSAQGRTKLCVVHGGGLRCQAAECTKSALGISKFCKTHGGGNRCLSEGCDKLPQPVGNGLHCKIHMAEGRCKYPSCTIMAQFKSLMCAEHSSQSSNTKQPILHIEGDQTALTAIPSVSHPTIEASGRLPGTTDLNQTEESSNSPRNQDAEIGGSNLEHEEGVEAVGMSARQGKTEDCETEEGGNEEPPNHERTIKQESAGEGVSFSQDASEIMNRFNSWCQSTRASNASDNGVEPGNGTCLENNGNANVSKGEDVGSSQNQTSETNKEIALCKEKVVVERRVVTPWKPRAIGRPTLDGLTKKKV